MKRFGLIYLLCSTVILAQGSTLAAKKAEKKPAEKTTDSETAQPQKKANDGIEMLAQRPGPKPLPENKVSDIETDPLAIIDEMDKADLAQR